MYYHKFFVFANSTQQNKNYRCKCQTSLSPLYIASMSRMDASASCVSNKL